LYPSRRTEGGPQSGEAERSGEVSEFLIILSKLFIGAVAGMVLTVAVIVFYLCFSKCMDRIYRRKA
jgi:uncharacterized membrane protein